MPSPARRDEERWAAAVRVFRNWWERSDSMRITPAGGGDGASPGGGEGDREVYSVVRKACSSMWDKGGGGSAWLDMEMERFRGCNLGRETSTEARKVGVEEGLYRNALEKIWVCLSSEKDAERAESY